MPTMRFIIGGSSLGIQSSLGIFSLFSCPCFAHSYFFFAVFLESRKAFAVGAPLLPTLRILSPDPLAMRSRFA